MQKKHYRPGSLRKKRHNYFSHGVYFITLVCQNRIKRFGEVRNKKMHYSILGQIAEEEWKNISTLSSYCKPGVFQVMPDHFHGIITYSPPPVHETDTRFIHVGELIGAYKSIVSNRCLQVCQSQNIQMGKLWQRNYYERIIHNEASLQRVIEYIRNNPANWSP